MTDLDLSLETADRVLDRVANGIVTFRAMNATEEGHVIRALRYYRSVALNAAEVAVENMRMKRELEDYYKRTADGLYFSGDTK